ncbi:hypothetical protein [Acetatifactor muris]|uniref:hypothetical protein n=1 Tax=Acetatifactor muris TaxID=879566 RepID=UPI0023F21F8D|nr:hypothetical protein [Acetatifactor muris]
MSYLLRQEAGAVLPVTVNAITITPSLTVTGGGIRIGNAVSSVTTSACMRLQKLLLDAAHDAYAVCQYCRRKSITPFIDLNPGHTGHLRNATALGYP